MAVRFVGGRPLDEEAQGQLGTHGPGNGGGNQMLGANRQDAVRDHLDGQKDGVEIRDRLQGLDADEPGFRHGAEDSLRGGMRRIQMLEKKGGRKGSDSVVPHSQRRPLCFMPSALEGTSFSPVR